MTTRHRSPVRALLAAASLAAAFHLAGADPVVAAGGPCGGCFAVVRADGTLSRGLPAGASVRRLGVGRYEVNFDTGAVDGCALTASLGNGGKFATPPGLVTVGRPASGATITLVDVATFDLRGRPADKGFHLTVTC